METFIQGWVVIPLEDEHAQNRRFRVLGQASRGNYPKGTHVLTPDGIHPVTHFGSEDGMELLIIPKE